MTDEKRLTTAERLEMHNLVALVKSARTKQAKGKALTKGEIAAVAELERRAQAQRAANPADGSKVAVGPVVRAMMKLATAADADLIREVLGTAAANSIPQVAEIFGVAQATVRNGWRRDGMPGTTRRGPGQRSEFPLAEVVIWCLQREEAADAGRRRASSNGSAHSDAAREELNAIELESARLGLEIRRSKVAELTGDLVSVSICRSEISSVLTVLRDDILEIPRHIKPVLPSKVADQVASEIDRLIRLDLTRISAQSQEQIIERIKRNEQENFAE